jgi:delta 1-pyrroline-5-carboxylate dehydrogenase
MEDETFGPILPIVAVDGASDALKRTNASRFALTTSIWSKKADKAAELAPLLKSGIVTINNHAFTAAIAAAPWTGSGDSGYGVTNSKHALMELTRPRFVLIDRASARSELWWMPYTPSLLATARAMAVLRSGTKSIFQKLAALVSLLGNAPKRLMGK